MTDEEEKKEEEEEQNKMESKNDDEDVSEDDSQDDAFSDKEEGELENGEHEKDSVTAMNKEANEKKKRLLDKYRNSPGKQRFFKS